MNKKIKLLIITQKVDIAKHCERVTVICLYEGQHHLPDNVKVLSLGKEENVKGATLRSYGAKRKSGKRSFLARFQYTIRFYRYIWSERKNYDSVFVHMNPIYVLLGGLPWRIWKKKIALWYTHKNIDLKLRIAEKFVHIIFTASKESFRLKSNKLNIMGHGIDTKRVIPKHIPPSGIIRMMTTGRISKTKRLDVMINAFLKLKKKGINSTFITYGSPLSSVDQEYKQKLSKQLVLAGEDPSAVFVGSVPHAVLPEKRAYADYLLHASETGSLDKNVLDACISGVIPVSSSEAYVDLFKGFEAYLVYPKGNSGALADRVMAIESLSKEKRKEIKIKLKERVVCEHSLGVLISKIESYFKE